MRLLEKGFLRVWNLQAFGQRAEITMTIDKIRGWYNNHSAGGMLDLDNRMLNVFCGRFCFNVTVVDEAKERAQQQEEEKNSWACPFHKRAYEPSNYNSPYGPYWMCRECQPEDFR